jgi:dephospho-CoA kinase
MKIFVVLGMPASGKGIARIYAESREIPYFATGDIVRGEVKRRGLEPNGINTAAVSTDLRGTDGLGVTRCALESALATGKERVFLEGMRSLPEIDLIRRDADVTVIAIIAPKRTRLKRVIQRNRSDDSVDGFVARDCREINYGAAVPIALADAYVLNTNTMENALDQLNRILEQEWSRE